MIKSDSFFLSVPATAELLRHLFPVQALLHVGAGAGKSAVRCWQEWDLAHVILIEANPEYKEKLQDAVTQKPGWHAISALIGDQDIEAEFFQASCPSESGVVPPRQWKKIWPNLAEITSSHLHQTRLDTLLINPSYGIVTREINWAVIDCMPALPILQGAGKYIELWDVIRIRAILDEAIVSMPTAGLSGVSDYLKKNKFRRIVVTESNHPAIGEAIFVKDWKVVLQDSRVHQAQQLGECQARIEQLSKAHDDQNKLAEERKSQLEQTTKSRDEQSQLATDRKQQIDVVQKETAEQKKCIQECQAQIDQLAKARDEQATLIMEQQQMIEQLESDLLEARQTADLSSKLTVLRESDLKELQERYKKSLQIQEQQHLLLTQLEERLHVAANYFHRLSGQ